jgi:diguanylate cyclase (GGDEF)-like protein
MARKMEKQLRLRAAHAKAAVVPARPRARNPEPVAEARAGPAASDPMRLAAEVARLEAELAAMRTRLAELESRAERDPLTAVLNRRGFERELARAHSYLGRYGGTAALVYLDLDGFKPVNDRHGHAAGDAVLKAVAAALVTAVRGSDAVARLGGDEFAVLLWNLTAPDAQKKALSLEQAIAAATVAWDGAGLSVGASAGIAELGAEQDAAAVLARADAEMYARKRRRKGPVRR